jgi:superfamily II DNA or RNA helicase
MSSSVNLDSCTFDGPTGSSYGFLLYDELDQTYCDLAESPILKDLELLAYAKESQQDVVRCILQYVRCHKKSMIINRTTYEWDKIKDIIS